MLQGFSCSGRYPESAKPAERVRALSLFHELLQSFDQLINDLIVACLNIVCDAGLEMPDQKHLAEAVKSSGYRRNLHKDIYAVAVAFQHSLHAADLTLYPLQTVHQISLLLLRARLVLAGAAQPLIIRIIYAVRIIQIADFVNTLNIVRILNTFQVSHVHHIFSIAHARIFLHPADIGLSCSIRV